MRVSSFVLGAAASLNVPAAAAHHAFSAFDMTEEKVVAGDIVEFQWTNPHTWTWIDVTAPDGTVTEWGVEGMSPNFLRRLGWTENTLKPGDHVVITLYPLKDGQPGGIFVRATLADGSLKVMLDRDP